MSWSIIFRITETKLANSELLEQLPSLPGYEFEFVPSPLSAGGVGMFISGEFKYSGTSERAKCLNHLACSLFSTVGQKLAANVPDSNCHYCEYLHVTNTNFTSSLFFEPVISSDRTRNLASTTKKAYGLCSCPIRVLKCRKKELSSPLAELINLSVQTGKYPSKLKHAKIIPVYKGNDETDPSNYHPISLLSVFNRIFEKIMYNQLKSYSEDNEVLYKTQYGFRETFSTQHAILDIASMIQTNMDKKMFTCSIFLDFKEVFDTVNHTILLDKLHHYGIRGIVHEWSYLANQTQTMHIDNDHISSKKNSVKLEFYKGLL